MYKFDHMCLKPDTYVWSQTNMFEPYISAYIYVWFQTFECIKFEHLCLKSDTYVYVCSQTNMFETYISKNTFMFDFKYWYVWNSTIYVWSQTLMSEARQICLGHACMYEVYSHICLKTTHFCMKPYIYVWSRYIEVSDAGWQLISFFWAIKCYFPPGRWSIGALELQKQYPVGLASTTLVGSVELLYRLSWWLGDGAHGI